MKIDSVLFYTSVNTNFLQLKRLFFESFYCSRKLSLWGFSTCQTIMFISMALRVWYDDWSYYLAYSYIIKAYVAASVQELDQNKPLHWRFFSASAEEVGLVPKSDSGGSAALPEHLQELRNIWEFLLEINRRLRGRPGN